jgi:hypothetical protein
MIEGLRIVTEMQQALWDQFRGSFDDLTEDEIHWRCVPQANSINVVVSHLPIYRKTRGEPARFFPDNPTYPRERE